MEVLKAQLAQVRTRQGNGAAFDEEIRPGFFHRQCHLNSMGCGSIKNRVQYNLTCSIRSAFEILIIDSLPPPIIKRKNWIHLQIQSTYICDCIITNRTSEG